MANKKQFEFEKQAMTLEKIDHRRRREIKFMNKSLFFASREKWLVNTHAATRKELIRQKYEIRRARVGGLFQFSPVSRSEDANALIHEKQVKDLGH